ncbi:MAG: MATE family efflux transporter [Bacteroidales bacterium]|nr:MATE family efflux transporter [Bacteroidales bacterium]
MNDNRDSIDFGSNNIQRLFASIFLPTVLGMLFSMAFIVTDGIFVGHGVGSYGLAAVNLIAPIMMLINGLGMMIGGGVSVVAAIHLSQGNTKAARINITQAYGAGVTFALLVALVCYAFPHTVLHLLGAQGDLYGYAYEYYLWFLPTCLFSMVGNIGMFVIRLDGSPRYAMMVNIVMAIVNIVLDYVFIFPCGMGLVGASLATDVGGLVGMGMVVYYMLVPCKTLRLRRIKTTRTSRQLTARNLGYMLRMGLPSLVAEIAVAVMMLTGNLMFLHYKGEDGVAAYSVICYLFPLVYMLIFAVSQSAQPIISFNHGAGNRERVRNTFRFSLLIGTLCGLVVMLVFIFLPRSIVSIFINPSEPSYTIASYGLPIYAMGFLFMAVNVCYVGYCQSIERARAGVFFTMLRGIIFMVACFVLMPVALGDVGLWLAIPCAEGLTTLCIVGYQIALGNKKKDGVV